MPVHAEFTREGAKVAGIFRVHGGEFQVVDGRSEKDRISGAIRGDGAEGKFSLQVIGERAEGTFELGGGTGVLTLSRTELGAAQTLAPAEQNLDLTPQQWREDLDQAVDILTTQHGSAFHRVSRSAFEAEAARIRAALPTMNGLQTAAALRRLGSMIGDGHTSIGLPRGQPRLPFEAFWFEDGLRIVRAPAAQRDLLGARITGVDGTPIGQVIKRLRVFLGQGENEWGFRSAAPTLLVRQELLRAAGLGLGATTRLDLHMPAGERRSVTLTPSTEPRRDWLWLGGAAPLWERRPDEEFWSERWPDGTVYVNWRGYEKLADASSRLLAELDRERPRRLIIDLRDNSGGDYNKGRAFISEIAKRPWLNRKGGLYVLTGRATFSASMTNAVDFQKQTRATLVGEPPGARPNNWQEGRRFTLKHSGLPVSVSTRYYRFMDRDTDALRPALRQPPVPSDWGAERDGAVRRILATR